MTITFVSGDDIILAANPVSGVPADTYTAQFVNGHVVLCSHTSLGETYDISPEGEVIHKTIDLTIPSFGEYASPGDSFDFGLLSDGTSAYSVVYTKPHSPSPPPIDVQMAAVIDGAANSALSPLTGNEGESFSLYGYNESIIYGQGTYTTSESNSVTYVITIEPNGIISNYIISSGGLLMKPCGILWFSAFGLVSVDVTTMTEGDDISFPFTGTFAGTVSGNTVGASVAISNAGLYDVYFLDDATRLSHKLVLPSDIANTPYLYMANNTFGVAVGLDGSIYTITSSAGPSKLPRAVYPSHLLVPLPAACIPLCEDNS